MEEPRWLVEDIVTRDVVCDSLPLVDWTVEDALGRPLSMSGKLPVTSPFANTEVLEDWRRGLYLVSGNRVDWGGILVATPRQEGSAYIDVQCVGWLGYWDSRTIRDDYQPLATEQFTIFKHLVDDAQNESLHGPGFNLGINVLWDTASGVTRDRTDVYLAWKAKKLGEALRELSGVEDGFDMAMEYSLDTTLNQVNRDIRLSYPAKGRNTGFLFDFEHGQTGGNIISWGSVPAGEFGWVVDGLGDGTEADRLRVTVVDDTARGIYPPVEVSASFSSVRDLDTLIDHTSAIAGRARRPQRLPVIRVNPNGPPAWGEYDMGDTILVRIDDGYGSVGLDTPAPHRIIGTRRTSSGAFSLTLQAA